MSPSSKLAFIDESGDSGLSLDKSGTSSHFVFTAVVVDESVRERLASEVEVVRRRYFQTGEMKSQSVGNDHARRLRILTALGDLEFSIVVIVVDKSRLARSGGFSYHEPFVKHLSQRLHRDLYNTFPNISAVADAHGDAAFMRSFADYVHCQLRPTLFDDYKLCFADSASEVLLQLADFICGTMALGYEVRRKTLRFKEFARAINKRLLVVREWPRGYDTYICDASTKGGGPYDAAIRQYAIRKANDYIRKFEDTADHEVRARVRLLEYLLFRLKFHRADLYEATPDLLKFLAADGLCPRNRRYLRNRIIAPLRDAGVLVASSAKGYKIPISEKELYENINHSLSIIKPMLDRLGNCRREVILATENGLDLFMQPEYALLQHLYPETPV